MRHWTEDELIASVYGVGPGDDHLATCGDCRARQELIEQRRALEQRSSELPPGFLAEQRRSVYARAEQPVSRPAWFRAAVACASVSVVAVGLVVTRPRDTAAADAQVIADAYAALAREVPRAAEPIDALFEEAP
jgi:hypothetical protein